MNLHDLIRIGDGIVNSIEKYRLANDMVLRGTVKEYQRLKSAAADTSAADVNVLKEISNSIREIEQRLDIVAPN